MGITDSIALGKTQIDTIKSQMETEQKNIAEIVCADLISQGLPCKVIRDGTQTMRAGVIPVRIERLKIIPTRTFTAAEKEKFEMEKSRLAYDYGKQRQEVYKTEMKELKQKEKFEKRATKQ
jgi:hypothetical protein